jgi:hypothetical protein
MNKHKGSSFEEFLKENFTDDEMKEIEEKAFNELDKIKYLEKK